VIGVEQIEKGGQYTIYGSVAPLLQGDDWIHLRTESFRRIMRHVVTDESIDWLLAHRDRIRSVAMALGLWRVESADGRHIELYRNGVLVAEDSF